MYHLDLIHTTLLMLHTLLKQCLDTNTNEIKKVRKSGGPICAVDQRNYILPVDKITTDLSPIVFNLQFILVGILK